MSHYNWKRFWCPRDGSLWLTSDGYLQDTGIEWLSDHSGPVAFDAIANMGCLVLLGEPGIGKSTALKEEYEQITQKTPEKGFQSLWIDLNQYSSESRLIADIFHHASFLQWKKQRHPFHLYIDSLDECKLRISTVVEIIKAEFRTISEPQNLFLRIACRTADWPGGLEAALKDLYGEENVGIYELAPLRRIDVAMAADANGIDPENFLNEVATTGIAPLASKPITLRFLLTSFAKSQGFASSQFDLYLDGCRLLASEINESRRDSGLLGAYSAEQKLDTAALIATIMILSNRTAVWTSVDRGNVPDTDLTVFDLSSYRIDDVKIEEALIRETLGTGLFSLQGSANRLGWSHQTYAEFLTAWYLKKRNTSLSQLLSLIIHPSDSTGKVIPQLRQLVGWLALHRPDLVSEIMRSNAELLLSGDMANFSESIRASIVEGILRQYDEKDKLDAWGNYRFYHKLNHPGLAGQLTKYIVDQERNLYVRRVAIDIAETCELAELQDELLKIALDKSEEYLRVDAAIAIVKIGDEDTKGKLFPLAVGSAGNDPDDGLKGLGLFAVWPKHMSTTELLAVLTPPKRLNLLGHYKKFLSSGFVENIPAKDLPAALEWASSHSAETNLPYRFNDAIYDIVVRSWNNLNTPKVLDAFASIVLLRLSNYEPIVEESSSLRARINKSETGTFRHSLLIEHEKRRMVMLSVLRLLPEPKNNVAWLVSHETPLCTQDDFVWLLEQSKNPDFQEERPEFLRLARLVYSWKDPDHVKMLLGNIDSIPEVADLRSAEERYRQTQDDLQIQQEEVEQRKEDKVTLIFEEINELLLLSKAGDKEAWWRIYLRILRDPRNEHITTDFRVDLLATPFWENADSELQVRLINAATDYLLEFESDTEQWVDEYLSENNVTYYPAYAGIAAMCMLLDLNQQKLKALDGLNWSLWAPLIAVYHIESESWGSFQNLVAYCYHQAPDEMIEGLLKIMNKEDRIIGSTYIVRRFENCWDGRLSLALIDMLADSSLQGDSLQTILQELIVRDIPEAKSFAISIIDPPYRDEASRKRAVSAALVLIQSSDDAGWDVVWPALNADKGFAKEVILGLGSLSDTRRQLNGKLNEDQLTDLFIWLVSRHPYEEEHEKDVGFGNDIRWLRTSILDQLKNIGTPEAVTAIGRIIEAFPEYEWLFQVLADAKEKTMRAQWIPLQPVEVLDLLNNQEGRLVQNGDDLINVLIASLKRLELRLHSETPAVIFLWNKLQEKKAKDTFYRPKNENEYSDFVKLHLEDDLQRRGIVLNREVEVQRRMVESAGQRTDIHVNAVSSAHSTKYDYFETISVVIEVKGNWNRELKDAMQEQLVNRYLHHSTYHGGIYLVGWFSCSQWDKTDRRSRNASQFSDIEAAKQYFDDQAENLSKRGVIVKSFVMDASLN